MISLLFYFLRWFHNIIILIYIFNWQVLCPWYKPLTLICLQYLVTSLSRLLMLISFSARLCTTTRKARFLVCFFLALLWTSLGLPKNLTWPSLCNFLSPSMRYLDCCSDPSFIVVTFNPFPNTLISKQRYYVSILWSNIIRLHSLYTFFIQSCNTH